MKKGGSDSIEHAVVVVNKTRIEQLIYRFNTKAQSKFYIEQSGGDFDDYQYEHDTFKRNIDILTDNLGKHIKFKVIEREFLPNYLFTEKDIVVVVGRDGLVANTAKYVNNIPILAINPDPGRFDGILLPYTVDNFEDGLIKVLENNYTYKQVTMAEAKLNDGQRLLAFNDLFIGPSSHISARYRIEYEGYSENQSSSGIIISTGAGSTGWLSSLMNQTNGINSMFDEPVKTKATKMPKAKPTHKKFNLRLEWGDNKLVFIVREPFLSKYSRTNLTAGMITGKNSLMVESFMPQNGIIFSDGIEADHIKFTSGLIANIGIAPEKAKIVFPFEKMVSKK